MHHATSTTWAVCGTPVRLKVGSIYPFDKDRPDIPTKAPYASGAQPHPVRKDILAISRETTVIVGLLFYRLYSFIHDI